MYKFFHSFSAMLWLKHVPCGFVHGQGCGCQFHSYGLANVFPQQTDGSDA